MVSTLGSLRFWLRNLASLAVRTSFVRGPCGGVDGVEGARAVVSTNSCMIRALPRSLDALALRHLGAVLLMSRRNLCPTPPSIIYRLFPK